jgi:putative transposase
MPWEEISVMQERCRFIERWLEHDKSPSELCREFGISRKTGYKIYKRFRQGGFPALENWSCRPHNSPNRTAAEVEQAVLEQRACHRSWGPKKLAYVLEREGVTVPARSTIAAILKRHGLARTPVCRGHGVPSKDLIVADSPNHVWCIDFKGWFRTGNGLRCDPLTAIDSYSRFLLCCHGLFDGTKTAPVREVFERLFAQYGLPVAILSDNGAPWASTSAGGLTTLSVWWIKLGIIPLRIYPGRPQQNGRLERFHRTLKHETAKPPAMTERAQQARFDLFRDEYNNTRPHEALNLVPPAHHYQPSPRAFAASTDDFDYPQHLKQRRVYKRGQINIGDRLYMISSALSGKTVALDFNEHAPEATVYLHDYTVGVLNLKNGKIAPPPRAVQLLRVGVPPPANPTKTPNQSLPTRLSVLPMSID